MKKIIIAVILLLGMTSCSPTPEGTINNNPQTVYRVNGKDYKAVNVHVDENSDIWLFIPLDSTTAVPISVEQKIPGDEKTPDKIKNTVIIR